MLLNTFLFADAAAKFEPQTEQVQSIRQISAAGWFLQILKFKAVDEVYLLCTKLVLLAACNSYSITSKL